MKNKELDNQEKDTEKLEDKSSSNKSSIEGEKVKESTPLKHSLLMYVLVSVLLVGIVWYFGDRFVGLNEQFAKAESDKRNSDLTLKKQIDSLHQKLEKTTKSTLPASVYKNTISDLNDHINSIELQLEKIQKNMFEEKSDVNSGILLSEVEFLIRTASVRLILTNSSKLSVRLLEEADRRIIRINDITLIPVREALKSDLYKLRAAEQVDITGAYLRLEVLITELNRLKTNFILPAKLEVELIRKSEKDSWSEHVAETTTKVFNKWFQVTHYTEKVKPLKSQQQVSFLKQALSLKIKQAQWALVQREFKLYQIVLNNLQKEIKENYSQQESSDIQREIKSLIAESMVAPLPKSLMVERTINEYMLKKKSVGNR